MGLLIQLLDIPSRMSICIKYSHSSSITLALCLTGLLLQMSHQAVLSEYVPGPGSLLNIAITLLVLSTNAILNFGFIFLS